MANSIKQLIKPFVPQAIFNLRRKKAEKEHLKEWYKNGCPVPPPHIIKQMIVQEYQKKYNYKTLVETGTYMGDMIDAQKNNFKNIFSIELGIDLCKKAQKRFRNYKHIEIIQGDSGKVLPKILQKINEPAIFWLDGHYSEGITAMGDKECPVFEEIDHIFNYKNFEHVLLIDDARHFVGVRDYPTIDALTNYIKTKNEKYQAVVENDIIRYTI